MTMTMVKCFGAAAILCGLLLHHLEAAVIAPDNEELLINGDRFAYSRDGGGGEELAYSDLEAVLEQRARLYRQLRQFGVPSDVAQAYVPRGLTVGDIFGGGSGASGSGKQPHNQHEDTESSGSSFDAWSIVWYIGSFGGLIAFFLVVSCSEWCCLRHRSAAASGGAAGGCPAPSRPRVPAAPETEAPPPAYDLFAPPPYESIAYGESKQGLEVYVVPVHCTLPPPPQYTTIAMPPPPATTTTTTSTTA